jgi:hypothetical protein
MRNRYTLALFFAGMISFSSCNIMYKPNMQNVALLKEKGEVKATISSANAQVSYALTDNIGIMANGAFGSSNWNTSLGTYQYKNTSNRFLGEAGLGYFTPLSDEFMFEVYGGGGFGKVSLDIESSFDGQLLGSSRYSADNIKLFLQPAIGTSTDNVDFAFSARITALKFNNIDTLNYTSDLLRSRRIYDIHQPTFIFVEPGATLRFGYKYLKFHMQVFYSLNTNAYDLNYRRTNVNMGLTFNIANRFKNK